VLYAKIDTTRILPGTRYASDMQSDAYHLIFRYRF